MWVDLKQFFFGRKVSDNSPQIATFTDDGKLRTDAEVQVNLPATYPLPQTQVDELRNVTVQATIGEVEIKNEAGNPVPVRTGADLHPLGDQLTTTQTGLVTQTVIHGMTTGGGGGYRDVKVTPSGALTVEATVVEPVALDAATLAALETVQVGNFPATQTVSATDLDIRNLSSAQDSVTVAGSVSVSNFPTDNALTDAQLRASAVPVSIASPVSARDAYTGGETLADQTTSNAVATFTFSSPVQLVYVYGASTLGTNTYRADPFGGTPSNTSGIPCPDGVATAIPVTTSSVSVYGASGTVSVWGFRY